LLSPTGASPHMDPEGERQPLMLWRKSPTQDGSDPTILRVFGSNSFPNLAQQIRSHIEPSRLVFLLLIVLQVLIHYDAGAIPASLGADCPTNDDDRGTASARMSRLPHSEADCRDPQRVKGMIHDFQLGYTQIGLLQSLVYLGLTVSCSVGGSLLQRYKAKWLVAAGLTLDTLCLVVLALTHNPVVCILSRFMLGLAQAYLILFLPVWIDEFAPADSSTTWLSLAQAGVPLGIMSGYLTAGFIAANTTLTWRAAIWTQIGLLTPVITIFLCVPQRLINIPLQVVDRTPGTPVIVRIGRQIGSVLGRPRFALTVMSLGALYYVVAALQLWITPYVHGPPLSQPLNTIVLAYALTSATAPVFGLVTGGWFMDHLFGGYRSSLSQTAQVAVCFGVVATTASFLVTITTSFWYFFLLIWVVLFCGAAAVPCCTGLSLSCVPKDLRPVACSVGMMVYNLVGWFSGPLLTGVVASVTGSLKWGFRFTMAWSGVSLSCILCVYYLTRRDEKKAGQTPAPLVAVAPSQNGDVELEVVMPPCKDRPRVDMETVASFSSVSHPSATRKSSFVRDGRTSSDPGGARGLNPRDPSASQSLSYGHPTRFC